MLPSSRPVLPSLRRRPGIRRHAPTGRSAHARTVGIALAALIAVALPSPAAALDAASAPVQTAASAVEWSVVPADADGPDGRVSLRHVIDPGETVEDAIAVTNLGPEASTFSVVAGDGRLGANGAFDIAGGEPEDSGAWINVDGLSEGGVEIAGGETRILPVTIDVPANATPGDHPAGIVVGVSSSDDDVTVVNRIGVRLHLQVSGEIEPRLEPTAVETVFEPSLIPFAPGTLRVTVDVVNVGNVRLGAANSVTTAGLFGWGATGAAATVDELLPGDAATIVTEVSAWPVFVAFGEATVSAASVGEDGVSPPEAVTESFLQAAVSWTGLIVLVLLIGVIVVRALVRRRRRRALGSSAPVEDAS